MSAALSVIVTLEQAQSIIDRARTDTKVANLQLFDRKSYLPCRHWYHIDVESTSNKKFPVAYLLWAEPPPVSDLDAASENSLPLVAKILSTISEHDTSIPILSYTLDTSLETVPFHYILFSLPHPLISSASTTNSQIISLAKAKETLPETDIMRLEMSLGLYLAHLHSIQNNWFGAPVLVEPADPSYSWQETFTQQLEHMLYTAELKCQLQLPYEDIRRYLSRAISFFLFDEVEVPSLVWFAGTDHDVFIQTHDDSDADPEIVMFLPSISHAIWGDPLLEAFFMTATGEPSLALREGYELGGGSPLIVFARQKTKRLWYNLYFALFVILRQDAEVQEESWAMKVLKSTLDALKDSPCY